MSKYSSTTYYQKLKEKFLKNSSERYQNLSEKVRILLQTI